MCFLPSLGVRSKRCKIRLRSFCEKYEHLWKMFFKKLKMTLFFYIWLKLENEVENIFSRLAWII